VVTTFDARVRKAPQAGNADTLPGPRSPRFVAGWRRKRPGYRQPGPMLLRDCTQEPENLIAELRAGNFLTLVENVASRAGNKELCCTEAFSCASVNAIKHSASQDYASLPVQLTWLMAGNGITSTIALNIFSQG